MGIETYQLEDIIGTALDEARGTAISVAAERIESLIEDEKSEASDTVLEQLEDLRVQVEELTNALDGISLYDVEREIDTAKEAAQAVADALSVLP